MSSELIWDTTKNFISYPKQIKNVYKKIYCENYKNYNLLINDLSKNNYKDFNWWLNILASRDERLSSIFHYICILKSLNKLTKLKKRINLIVKSKALKKIIDSKNLKNFRVKVINENFLLQTIKLMREFFIFVFAITVAKIINNHEIDKHKDLNLIDMFNINQKNQKKLYFGKYFKKIDLKFLYVPTFLSYSPKQIFKNFKNDKTVIKEKYVKFKDIFFILKNLLFKKFYLNKNIKNDYKDLFYEEINSLGNLRSVMISYINFIFFKNLSEKGIKIKKVISWHENQIIDKGWSLGLKYFYPESDYIGYQGSTLHPQFFNLSPTKYEYLAGAIPKKVVLVGKKYKNNREQFFKGIKFEYEKNNRFNFNLKCKKKTILFLLTGIKQVDQILLNLSDKCSKEFKNVKIKFHPICPSKNFGKKYKNEITGNASKIICSSKIVITSSYTSGLYESMGFNSKSVLIEFTPLDEKLFNDLSKYTNQIEFCKDELKLKKILRNLMKKPILINKHNFKVKKLFFNK